MSRQILGLLWQPVLFILFVASLAPVSAQTTNATCLASWQWAENSRGQNPCLVGAYLLAPCASGQWNIPALQSGQYYRPPTTEEANQCQCSSVVYQLISACGSCQGQGITAWSTWIANCSSDLVSVASYPLAISPATAVPAWAYIDITESDQFIATVASAALDSPESTAGGPSSTTSASTTTSSSTETASESSAPSTSSNDNTGVIVGSVVGGVVGLGLIACLILFLLKRTSLGNHKKSAPSAEFAKYIPPGGQVPSNFDPAAVGFRSRTASPLNNGLNTDPTGGYGVQDMRHAATNQGNGNGMVSFGAPWSPPPVGLTPAPNSGPYAPIYTPPPPEMARANVYTPPPGVMNSAPTSSHFHQNTPNSSLGPAVYSSAQYQNMGPYGGQMNRGARGPGLPEL